jgi:hypothetical protein
VPYDWSSALPEAPWTREVPGVFSQHDDACPVRFGRRCTCGPQGYFATVVDPATGSHLISPLFASVGEAQEWQSANPVGPAVTGGTQQWHGATNGSIPEARSVARESDRKDLGGLIEDFFDDAEDARTVDFNGKPYARERLRALRGALSYADANLGTLKIEDIRRRNVQALVDQLRAAGVGADRVNDVADALRIVYSYAIQRGLVDYSPVVELVLPESENGGGQNSTGSYSTNPLDTPPAALQPPGAYPTPPPYGTPPPSGTPGPYPPPPSYPTAPGYPIPSGYPAPASNPTAMNAGFPTPGVQPFLGQGTSQGMPVTNSANNLMTRVLGGPPGSPAESLGNYDATQQERFLWWTVRIVVIVFVLIALVLVAESV